MFVLDEIRQRARLIVGPILGVSLVAYFAYHLLEGDRGLFAMLQLSHEIQRAQGTLADIRAQEDPLAHRVALMRTHINADLLDERARATLDLIGPDEVAIFYNNKPQSGQGQTQGGQTPAGQALAGPVQTGR